LPQSNEIILGGNMIESLEDPTIGFGLEALRPDMGASYETLEEILSAILSVNINSRHGVARPNISQLGAKPRELYHLYAKLIEHPEEISKLREIVQTKKVGGAEMKTLSTPATPIKMTPIDSKALPPPQNMLNRPPQQPLAMSMFGKSTPRPTPMVQPPITRPMQRPMQKPVQQPVQQTPQQTFIPSIYTTPAQKPPSFMNNQPMASQSTSLPSFMNNQPMASQSTSLPSFMNNQTTSQSNGLPSFMGNQSNVINNAPKGFSFLNGLNSVPSSIQPGQKIPINDLYQQNNLQKTMLQDEVVNGMRTFAQSAPPTMAYRREPNSIDNLCLQAELAVKKAEYIEAIKKKVGFLHQRVPAELENLTVTQLYAYKEALDKELNSLLNRSSIDTTIFVAGAGLSKWLDGKRSLPVVGNAIDLTDLDVNLEQLKGKSEWQYSMSEAVKNMDLKLAPYINLGTLMIGELVSTIMKNYKSKQEAEEQAKNDKRMANYAALFKLQQNANTTTTQSQQPSNLKSQVATEVLSKDYSYLSPNANQKHDLNKIVNTKLSDDHW
jgi:hypothetical protein